MTQGGPPPNEEDRSPYAGRWIARVRGQIVGQGGTPEQARQAAAAARPKENPEIVFMQPSSLINLSPLVDKVRAILPDRELYLVGGSVRDALLGRVNHDLDFVLPADGIRTARRVADKLKADFFPLDEERDTGRVIVTNADGSRDLLDFATLRGGDLDADLQGRDFTVNAMALDLRTMSLLDPLGGAADLRAKRLRACLPTSFSDDPVRILRGVRLAAAFGFTIEAGTRKAMRAAGPLLPRVSPERLRDELFRILEGPQPAASLRALELLGVLPHLLPELPALKGVEQPAPHVYDVWEHTLQVLAALEDVLAALAVGYDPETTGDLFTGLLALRLGRYREQFAAHLSTALNADRSPRGLLFFTALYHDVAKPSTRTVEEGGRVRFLEHDELGAQAASARARALHLSNDEIERVAVVIKNHMRLHYHTSRMAGGKKHPSRRAIYRFFRDSGAAGVDLVLLALADLRATHGQNLSQETWAACLDVCRIFLENYWERPEEVVAPPRLVDGNDMIRELGLQPGPRVGQVLEAVREAQAMGKVSTRGEAVAFGRKWLEENPEK
ncbi:MAG: HD domain-containing protein [Chloroflexota bacterium]